METESSSALLKWPKKLEGTYAPSHANFSPDLPDQNFQIAILFSIVEILNDYVFGCDLLPHSPQWREGLQVKNFDQRLHIVMVIGKRKDVFRRIFFWLGKEGQEKEVKWEDLYMEN